MAAENNPINTFWGYAKSAWSYVRPALPIAVPSLIASAITARLFTGQPFYSPRNDAFFSPLAKSGVLVGHALMGAVIGYNYSGLSKNAAMTLSASLLATLAGSYATLLMMDCNLCRAIEKIPLFLTSLYMSSMGALVGSLVSSSNERQQLQQLEWRFQLHKELIVEVQLRKIEKQLAQLNTHQALITVELLIKLISAIDHIQDQIAHHKVPLSTHRKQWLDEQRQKLSGALQLQSLNNQLEWLVAHPQLQTIPELISLLHQADQIQQKIDQGEITVPDYKKAWLTEQRKRLLGIITFRELNGQVAQFVALQENQTIQGAQHLIQQIEGIQKRVHDQEIVLSAPQLLVLHQQRQRLSGVVQYQELLDQLEQFAALQGNQTIQGAQQLIQRIEGIQKRVHDQEIILSAQQLLVLLQQNQRLSGVVQFRELVEQITQFHAHPGPDPNQQREQFLHQIANIRNQIEQELITLSPEESQTLEQHHQALLGNQGLPGAAPAA